MKEDDYYLIVELIIIMQDKKARKDLELFVTHYKINTSPNLIKEVI